MHKTDKKLLNGFISIILLLFLRTFHRMFVQCHLWKAKTASVTMVISPRYVIPDLIIIKTTIGFHIGLGLIDLLVGISQQQKKNLDKSPQIVITLSKKWTLSKGLFSTIWQKTILKAGNELNLDIFLTLL